MSAPRHCPGCGRPASGNFCSQCGTPLANGSRCRNCTAALHAGALFCPECGAPTGARPGKPVAAYLPWILSGLALVAFSVAITLFIRGQVSVREPGMPPTGGILSPQGNASTGGAGVDTSPSGGMPTAAELAAMPPREAADRLFDRAMSTREAGDTERAAFFARMAVEAYRRVPPAELDEDAHFHIGLLHLAVDDPVAARSEAEAILKAAPDHLLGLILSARAASAAGDPTAAQESYAHFLRVLAAEQESGRVEYGAHEELIAREAEAARASTG
ncbi:MAG: zinc ribbon domain-containing protein [Gemmatimonadota bacterium]